MGQVVVVVVVVVVVSHAEAVVAPSWRWRSSVQSIEGDVELVDQMVDQSVQLGHPPLVTY